MPYQSGEILLNKYRIERMLGHGAFGEVYLATHLALNVPRALKMLRKDAPGLGSQEYERYHNRFQAEAALGARLNSPNPHANLLQVSGNVGRKLLHRSGCVRRKRSWGESCSACRGAC